MNTESLGSSSGGSTPMDPDDTTPLWKYVTKLDKIGEGGGNCKFQCNCCHLTFKGSYTRVKSHLLRITGQGIRGCSNVTSQDIQEMQRLVDQAELRVKKVLPKQVPVLPSTSSQPSSSLGANLGMGALVIASSRQEYFEPRKRKATGNTTTEKAFDLDAPEQLNNEISKMFYSAGLPFQLARNPYFISSFSFAANNLITDFQPPNYKELMTTLLQKEKENIERLLEPIKSTWKDKGISIVNDGWADAQKWPLITFMAVTNGRPVFLKAVDSEGEDKDEHFIANLIKETIEEVGPQKVVQVITNDAPVCRAAGLLVEAQYPHVFWTPCVVHTLDIALKNICAAKIIKADEITSDDCSWITIILRDAVIIKNFVMNHPMRLAIFNQFVSLKMLAIADTRFASEIIMLKRFKLIKSSLLNMVSCDEWACFKENDVQKAQFVKEKVLDDLWWDKIEYILSFTEPIYEMLRIANTGRPCLHLVYDLWDSMIEKVKTIIYQHERKREDEESTFYSVVHKILVDGWNRSNTPLHCLAHSLNPRYYSTEWLNEAPNRVAPHKDVEISAERNKCLKRYFVSCEERRMVNVEFAKFSAALDKFADDDSLDDRGILDPIIWWIVHGSPTPTLQNLALKLLGQPCSMSSCERNWSTYSFINSIKRNKMKSQQAKDLVFVHFNLRLLSRTSPQYKEGESKMWDVGGDAFESFEGAGILDIADLSLDEPDLEAAIFADESNDNDGQLIVVRSN